MSALAADLPAAFLRFCDRPHRAVCLRGYQRRAAVRILTLLAEQPGAAVVLVMARQAGKDEILAHLQAFLLEQAQATPASLVMVTPTATPQGLIAKNRLLRACADAGLA